MFTIVSLQSLIPTLPVSGPCTDQASQSEQNSMLSSSVVFYMYSRTCTNSVWHGIYAFKFTSSSMRCDRVIALQPSVEWHSLSRVGQESYFCPQNYYTLVFVHSRASSTENKWSTHPLPLSSTPYPFPVSLTHAHLHTLLNHHCFPLFLRHSQRKNGRYILMGKWWPWLIILSLKNGSNTFSASMCLLVDRPVIVVRLRNQWNPFASLTAVWRGIQQL